MEFLRKRAYDLCGIMVSMGWESEHNSLTDGFAIDQINA